MRQFKYSTFATGVVLFISTIPVAALAKQVDLPRAPAPMTPVDMVEIASISEASVSADGSIVSFVESRSDWKRNRTIDRLVLIDTADGHEIDSLVPSSATEDHDGAIWSPDGNRFLTILKRKEDDHNQVYIFEPASKELDRLTEHPASVKNVEWAPDGKGFYFVSDNLSQVAEDNDWSPRGYEFSHFEELFFYDLALKSSDKIISSDAVISGYDLSRDGKRLLVRMRGQTRKNDKEYDELYLMDARGGAAAKVTDNFYQERFSKLSPDNTRVAFVAPVSATGEAYYEPNAFIQTIGAAQPVLLLPDMSIEVQDINWDRDGTGVFILGTVGLTTQLFHYGIQDNKLSQITHGDHEISDWRYDPIRDQHIAKIASATNPGDIFEIDGQTGGLKNLSRRFENFAQRFALPRQEAIRWRGKDGYEVEGLLVYPLDYEQGSRYPLATIAHGGPRSAVNFGSWSVSRYVPVLAAQGYMIFLPNYRGGTAYGDTFLRDMEGNYFNNSDDDVLTGIDALVGRGLADPDKLIMMGWSAGGHMTNWLVSQTDRFKAAASGAGASDWVSMFGESDFRRSREFMFGGAPWGENAPLEVFRETSPLSYAHNIKAPLLLWSGKNDERVPATQNIILFRALQDLGIESEFYLLSGEPHNFKKPRNQLFKINREMAWFAEHLGEPPFAAVMPTGGR